MLSFYFIFYLAALVVSLAYFKKFVDTPLRFFPLLIAYTLFNEILGFFIINYEEFSFFDEEAYNWHNVIIYNIYGLVFLGYFFWVYHEMIKRKNFRKLIKSMVVITYLTYGVSLFFQDPFHSDLYYADCVGSLAMITCIFLHLRELKRFNHGINRYNLMVWISSGLLLFNIFFPFYILNGYLNVDFFLKYHLRQILWVIVSLMYLLFIIGFIVSKRITFR